MQANIDKYPPILQNVKKEITNICIYLLSFYLFFSWGVGWGGILHRLILQFWCWLILLRYLGLKSDSINEKWKKMNINKRKRNLYNFSAHTYRISQTPLAKHNSVSAQDTKMFLSTCEKAFLYNNIKRVLKLD